MATANSTEQPSDRRSNLSWMSTSSPHSSAVEVDSNIRSSPLPSPQYGSDQFDEKEVFSQIQKPRVRYDVEVVKTNLLYTQV